MDDQGLDNNQAPDIPLDNVVDEINQQEEAVDVLDLNKTSNEIQNDDAITDDPLQSDEREKEETYIEELSQDTEQQSEEVSREEISQTIEPEKPKKKKKTGTIILLIIFLLILAGGMVVYFLLFNDTKNNDQGSVPVPEEKIHTDPEKKNEFAIVGNGLNNFDLSFLRLENNNKNIIYSPLSIKYALSMLKDGTTGNSKQQIEDVLGTYYLKQYKNSANLSLANAIFVNTKYKDSIKEAYSNSLNANYDAALIFDEFDSPANINSWVSQKTFNQVNDILDSVDKENGYFYLVNALAVDMEWINKIQVTNEEIKNGAKEYNISFAHEVFNNSVIRYETRNPLRFAESESKNVDAVQIAATANRYDIIKELGEDGIRNKVQEEYDIWAEARRNELNKTGSICDNEEQIEEAAPDIDEYVSSLSDHYGHVSSSTDFYFADNKDIKVFAKDLKTYDGSTLQYVGIMPKNESLENYLSKADANQISKEIGSIKEIKLESFKEGTITKLKASIPLFSFDYTLDFIKDLQSIGITDVFDRDKADLSGISDDAILVTQAIHSANIDFSNDGIKAGAATVIGGGRGAGTGCSFKYDFEPPVEEIDLTFDNPYLFLIRDKDSGEVWFIGSVYEPNSAPAYNN